MNDQKKRRRTGCLTCRTRRVKCDEGKPFCGRCDASNIECLGYEQKRHIEVRQSRCLRGTSTPQTVITSPKSAVDDSRRIPQPKFRSDGLPLVALPNNPLPSQRPHSGARHVLAYHQYLFRTLPVLFPANHLHFWRDRFCEEAWETEYVYDTIMALGSIHRATLLMSTTGENDRNRSLDTKVIAVQAYTKALQELSEHLDETESTLEILVGVLLLLAYVECFAGNIPAAFRHVRVANQYFTYMLSDMDHQGQPFMIPIAYCLRNLALLCRIVIPIPSLNISLNQTRVTSPNISMATFSSTSSTPANSGFTLLADLFDLVSDNNEIENLIWNPLAVCQRSISPEKIYAFQEELRDWNASNSHLLPQYDSENTLTTLSSLSWSVIDGLPVPPQQYSAVSSQSSLVAGLYNFYMARTMWALSLLDNDSEQHELSAYSYSYEVMRWAATFTSGPRGMDEQSDVHLPCENLNIGFVPMLYIIGQNSPQPAWLRWIMERLSDTGQEGLFNGKVLAKSLNALYTFERFNNIDSSSMFERFPSPKSRVISVLIPEENGRSLIAYYASHRSNEDQNGAELYQYYPIGHARWSNVLSVDMGKPEVEFYSEERIFERPFTEDWLLSQNITRDWISWASDTEFNLDRALRDHINGNRLLPVTNEMET